MEDKRGIRRSANPLYAVEISPTSRQVEVLRLAGIGLSGKQIARRLGISVRTVEDHFSALRQRTGVRSQGQLIAYWTAAGLVKPGLDIPEAAISGTAAHTGPAGQGHPVNLSGNYPPRSPLRDESGDGQDNGVRIGYVRITGSARRNQAQLDTVAAAQCREVLVEAASSHDAWPQLRRALDMLQTGDTLVIYKPDRVARSIKELLILLEDRFHADSISLHILSGPCAGLHRPDGTAIADKMLFTVAAMAAEMERDLFREHVSHRQRRGGGRPAAVTDDILAIARACRERGESVTAIARHLGVGRSTLYRALDRDPASPAAGDTDQ